MLSAPNVIAEYACTRSSFSLIQCSGLLELTCNTIHMLRPVRRQASETIRRFSYAPATEAEYM